MKKRMGLIFLSVLLLTGCGGNQTQPTKVKEEKIEIVKIESNKPKIKESKVINVFKIYDRGDGEFKEADKELIDQTFSMFNDTEQQVYKDSLTFLPAKSFYDEIENQIYVGGVLYNNTENQIRNVKFEGELKFKINEDEFLGEDSFSFNNALYPFIDPYEGVSVLISFDAQEFGGKLSPNYEYTSNDIQVNLKDIKFSYKK